MEAVFLKIINMSISSAWLIFAVVIIRFFLKKALGFINMLLWGIVAVKLILPFSFESVLSLVPSGETVPQNIMITENPVIHSGVTVIDKTLNPMITDTFAPTDISSSVNPMQIIVFVSAMVWLVGIAGMLLYSVISYFILKNRVKASLNVLENIYICDGIASPFVLGFFKPRIYIPSTLNEAQTSYVLSHERAHIKRLDQLWKLIGFCILAIHWFNPAVWVAYTLFCRDIEYACDEKVIKTMERGEITAYSETLLACSVSKRIITACPVAFGEVGVKQRIKYILNYKKPVFWVTVIAAIVCIAAAIFFFTDPPSDIIGESGMTDNGGAWFDAVILEDLGDTWLVKPCEGTRELKCSDKIYVPKTQSNEIIALYGYGEKSIVRIFYDSMIQETYPAKIPNVYKIELRERFKTNIRYETESAYVKYVDYNDPIYTNALNADYLSNDNSPVHLVNSYEEMKSLLEPYDLEDGNKYGVSLILEKFDNDYFDENSVLLIYVLESTHMKNKVYQVGKMDSTLNIIFTQILLDSDREYATECSIIAIGTGKSNLEGVNWFYANAEIEEKLLKINE